MFLTGGQVHDPELLETFGPLQHQGVAGKGIDRLHLDQGPVGHERLERRGVVFADGQFEEGEVVELPAVWPAVGAHEPEVCPVLGVTGMLYVVLNAISAGQDDGAVAMVLVGPQVTDLAGHLGLAGDQDEALAPAESTETKNLSSCSSKTSWSREADVPRTWRHTCQGRMALSGRT